jgi:dolichol-phosphate mannosyltransferase
MTKVSVIVPVFGCDQTLEVLTERVSKTLEPRTDDFELLFVDDGNSGDTWKIIRDLASKHKCIRGIRLSRNFGQHPAIMAGIRSARGDLLVILDCDLQDPIEEIPKFLESLASFEVAISLRKPELRSRVRSFQSAAYVKILKLLTGVSIDPRAGGLVAMTRKVANEYIQFREPDHHLLYTLDWLGFATTYIETDRHPRLNGRSSYGLVRRVKHAVRGALFHSARLVLFVALLGAALASIGALTLLFILIRAIGDAPVSGWLSTIGATILLTGFNLIVTATIALYVTRTFELAKQRPLFVVSEEL